MLLSTLILSTNLLANKPSKIFEIKVEPISAITDDAAKLGFESGYKNFCFGLDFAMLVGNGKFGYQNPEFSFLNMIMSLGE